MAGRGDPAKDLARWRHIYNNIFLPRKLPTTRDSDELLVGSIIKFVHDIIAGTRLHLPWSDKMQGFLATWNHILDKSLSSESIFERLTHIQNGDHFAMFLSAQNAAITVSVRQNSALVTSFRVSPGNSDIMSNSGSLVAEYPTHAVRVPIERVKSEAFARQLAELSAELYTDMLPTARKAGIDVPDTWDVPDSAYVTTWLIGTLAGTNPPATDILRIKKVIRDEVICDGHGCPWRRSGEWMTLKIVLQWVLMSEMGVMEGFVAYKLTMVSIMTEFVRELGSKFPVEDRMFMMAKVSRRMQKVEKFVQINGLDGWIEK